MIQRDLCLLTCLAGAVSAQAQIEFSINVAGIVSPESPTTTVELWARFTDQQWAFAGAKLDLNAQPDAGGFTEFQTILDAIGTSDGILGPGEDSVLGIIGGQLHFPLGDYYADTSNPILVWSAVWGTADFTPRKVGLATDTTRFFLYLDDSGMSKDFVGQGYMQSEGEIEVVPAPAACLALGFLAAVGRSRRARPIG